MVNRAPSGAPSRVKGVSVSVHYELYQGMPLMAKWVEAAAETSESKGARVGVNAVEVSGLFFKYFNIY